MDRSALLSVVLLAGCAPAASQTLPTADFVLVDKSDRVLTLFAAGKPYRNYHGLQLGGAPEGHKRFEGDERTPEGRYTMSASKQGYIGGSYGQRIPGRAGTPIQLADGQQMRLQMQIWRGSVITGIVLDETGEAIPNTPVRVFRYVFQGGQRVLQSAWWLALFPGIALVLTVLTLNLLGDALRDALDPRARDR